MINRRFGIVSETHSRTIYEVIVNVLVKYILLLHEKYRSKCLNLARHNRWVIRKIEISLDHNNQNLLWYISLMSFKAGFFHKLCDIFVAMNFIAGDLYEQSSVETARYGYG